MIKKSWNYTHSIGVVGDTHVGSRYSLWPPDFKTKEGNPLAMNPTQQKLWGFWTQFKQALDDFQCEEIWHVGDLMDGQNHKGQALGLLTTDMSEQREAAFLCLKPLIFDENGKKIRHIHCIGGSDYHQGATPGQFPEAVVVNNMLEGTYHGPIMKVRFADSNRIFLVSHGGGGAFMYPETQAGRELMTQAEWEAIEKCTLPVEFEKEFKALVKQHKLGGLKVIEHVDAFICGHLHHAPLHIEKYGQHFIRTGTWKIWDGTRFGFNPYGRKQPKCTTGILLIDDHDRTRYISFDYKPMPKIWDVTKVIGGEKAGPTEAELDQMTLDHSEEVKRMDVEIASGIDESMGGEE